MGGTTVGDKTGRHAVAELEQIGDLLPRAVEPRRRQIGCRHRWRHLEHDHRRGSLFGKGRRFALPGRPCRGQGDHAYTGQQQMMRTQGTVRRVANDEMLQQRRIDHLPPPPCRIAGPMARPPQEDRGREQQQCPGPQQMEVLEEGDHDALQAHDGTYAMLCRQSLMA